MLPFLLLRSKNLAEMDACSPGYEQKKMFSWIQSEIFCLLIGVHLVLLRRSIHAETDIYSCVLSYCGSLL
jgi:hypothetical protein